ncbi:MAG: hypothetical protein QM704_10580 [Anaeromyxobacteraceae bacterium]
MPSPVPAAPGPWPHTALEGRTLRLDGDRFEVGLPGDWAHFIDPRLPEVLPGWGLEEPGQLPGFRRSRLEAGRVLALSLDHAWAAAAWARCRAGGPLTVVHLDRHTDCGAPLLLVSGEGGLVDCLSGAPVGAGAPESLEGAAASGAVGIGGFIAPAVALGLVGRVVHVYPARTPLPAPRERTLSVGAGDAHPRRPDLRWLAASLEGAAGTPRWSVPYVAAHASTVPAGLPGPVVLDVDLDFASNRYRGDPDWEGTPGPELAPEAFAAEVGEVLDRLEPARVVGVTVALSPGFCPVEAWRPLAEALSGVLRVRLGVSLEGLGPWER